jgi:hypothetical protein
LLLLSLTLITLPLWEAAVISFRANRLCSKQGGLHVYKTVEAEGFLGGSSIKYWSKYGFSYLEVGGANKKKFKLTMQNGEVHREELAEFNSRYQVKSSAGVKKYGNTFRRSSARVIDRETQEVLGELVTFSIYPSKFDLLALRLTRGEYNPWICGNEAPQGEGSYSPGDRKHLFGISDVIKATILPIRVRQGAEL